VPTTVSVSRPAGDAYHAGLEWPFKRVVGPTRTRIRDGSSRDTRERSDVKDLDEALERFHLCGCEYGDGIPNYGPMAVESLEVLGHGALVIGLLDVYAPRLPPLVEGSPLGSGERSGALGRYERVGDWLATYERELAESDWRAVVERALEVLAAGVDATAIHGLIRLAHAVRGIETEENEHRVRELAFGLAYWSARFSPTSATDTKVPPARSESDAGGDALAAASLSGAERYLAEPDARAAFSLGVTGPSALRILSPHLSEQSLQLALVGTLASCPRQTGGAPPQPDPEVARCVESLDEIRYRAACSIHEHAITMAEACLRENAINPHATLRLAAADAALRLSPPGYQEWR
jgi:hypothetical protein